MAKGTCSICAAPAAVLAAVNAQLEKRVPLRTIAKESAFSRASLSRHARSCLDRQRIVQHGSVLGDLAAGRARLIRAQPQRTLTQVNGRPTVNVDTTGKLAYATDGGCGPIITETELLPTDIILRVNYEAEAALQPAEIPAETTPN